MRERKLKKCKLARALEQKRRKANGRKTRTMSISLYTYNTARGHTLGISHTLVAMVKIMLCYL